MDITRRHYFNCGAHTMKIRANNDECTTSEKSLTYKNSFNIKKYISCFFVSSESLPYFVQWPLLENVAYLAVFSDK